MRTFAKAIVTIGSAVAPTAGMAFSVSADESASIKYRQMVMKAVGGHMGGSVAIIKGKVPYKDNLVAHATGLNDMANVAANAFKQKTQAGKTRAKPNITPDKATGIGDWSASELVDYLSGGVLPDGDYAGGLMAGVIDDGLKYLTPEDTQAIAEYITTLPAIEHATGDEDGGG